MLLSKENITLVNLILIQQVFGAGSLKAIKIFNILRDANILDNNLESSSLSAIDKKDADKLLSFDKNIIFKIIDDCIKNDISIVTICDSEYPDRLRNINDYPIVLYIKGEIFDIDNLPLISIVGPRKVSDFGIKASFSLSKRLSRAGMIVVSGAAIGADTYAHKGAIAAGGKTIAVLGCGICHDYLSENRFLREQISKNGCLISEYPPFAAPTKYSFPIRNRIISALSVGTVVMRLLLKVDLLLRLAWQMIKEEMYL